MISCALTRYFSPNRDFYLSEYDIIDCDLTYGDLGDRLGQVRLVNSGPSDQVRSFQSVRSGQVGQVRSSQSDQVSSVKSAQTKSVRPVQFKLGRSG